MTWKLKNKSNKSNKGTRIIRRFALFPIKAGNKIKWLEVCYILQREWNLGYESGWEHVKFVDKNDYVNYIYAFNNN